MDFLTKKYEIVENNYKGVDQIVKMSSKLYK